MGGWKVFRWSLRGMQDKERFKEEMNRFFGSADNFRKVPHFLASRQLDVLQFMEHQEEALFKIESDRNAGKNTFLLLLPTGTGKTEIFLGDFHHLKATTPNLTGLILVPTSPLRDQALDRLALRLPEFTHGTSYQRPGPNAGFMVQTYQHMTRHFEKYAPRAFDYIVVDEAHHAAAPGLRTVLQHFQPMTLLGATATDKRLDSKRLEDIFGSYETSLSLQEAIEKNLLPPIRAFRVQSNIDLSNVRYNGADYVQNDLQKTLLVRSRDELVVSVIERYFGQGLTAAKQGVIFCVNVRHAKDMASLMNRHGILAIEKPSENWGNVTRKAKWLRKTKSRHSNGSNSRVRMIEFGK
jgi:superfamily II DNA or RNA helicase